MNENTTAAGSTPTPGERLRASQRRYWRANIAIMTVLLFIWLVAGLGCGVLFADTLNQYQLGGFPLGFWFAQQGSIIVFVLLILVYAICLNRLDGKHHAEIDRFQRASATQDTETGA